jgi:TetR/AcrR family transcriptional repressor of nem operon
MQVETIVTTETTRRIVDSARRLVQRRGYEGLRYADVSDEVGIRRASIHHHFPRKRDLARAVITSYSEQMQRQLDAIDRSSDDALARLERYAGLYRAVLDEDPEHMCPGGMLAADAIGLPDELRGDVEAFFALNVAWLTRVLAAGVEQGSVTVAATPENAQHTLASLQGALLMARFQASPAFLDATMRALRDWLTHTRPESAD